MATYTDLPDSAISHKKPITLQQGRALRDNPLAMFEGADTAPRLHLGALPRLTAGAQVRSRYDSEVSDTVSATSLGVLTATAIGLRFGIMQSGTVTVSLEHQTGDGVVRRIRNGVSTDVAVYTGNASWQARTVNVSVLPGDEIRLVSHGTSNVGAGGGSLTVRVRNCRISTGGEDLWPGIPAPLEGMTYA